MRGYVDGEVNHCPGCGGSHWRIGRLTAECAFCTTALPLNRPDAVLFERRVPETVRRAAA